MPQKCPVCGTWVPSGKYCPQCGMKMEEAPAQAPAPAPAPQPDRWQNRTPQTIEELQQWYRDRNLPPQETTRFFIGIDYKEPRAFGIYREPDGTVTVYKNKDSGERAVRYCGPDEAYGVNELYLRLKQEIANQKSLNYAMTPEEAEHARKNARITKIMTLGTIAFFVIVFIVVVLCEVYSPEPGYYSYDGYDYYYLDSSWYWYDSYADEWEYCYDTPEELEENYDDYYYDEYYGAGDCTDFEDTQYYEDYEESQSSDSDSWDSSGSWDSGGTDFSSDW